jgi:hypothetical protein
MVKKMALEINEEDPCGAAKKLRSVYYGLITGQASMVVTFKAGSSGVERSVTFNKADPSRLLAVIRDFEEKCARKHGGRPRRFALAAGGVR